MIGKNVCIDRCGNDTSTSLVGKLVAESDTYYCLQLESGVFLSFSKEYYEASVYKSPEDILDEKLTKLLFNFYDGDIGMTETIERIISLFKESE